MFLVVALLVLDTLFAPFVERVDRFFWPSGTTNAASFSVNATFCISADDTVLGVSLDDPAFADCDSTNRVVGGELRYDTKLTYDLLWPMTYWFRWEFWADDQAVEQSCRVALANKLMMNPTSDPSDPRWTDPRWKHFLADLPLLEAGTMGGRRISFGSFGLYCIIGTLTCGTGVYFTRSTRAFITGSRIARRVCPVCRYPHTSRRNEACPECGARTRYMRSKKQPPEP